VTISRRTLFQNSWLQIGLFEARPLTDACGEVERQNLNAMVLPFAGVFSKYDAPKRYVVGTPSHAIFVAADTPYRIGFPGAIGDRALTFRFDVKLAPEQLEGSCNGHRLNPQGLLPPNAMVLRNLLWRRLDDGTMDEFETETVGLDLLTRSLSCIGLPDLPMRAAHLRQLRGLERVKEAVALAPAHKWSVKKLAAIANMSPFHFCHTFRQFVGASVYDYVVRERLARALDDVLERSADITEIALDAGFASHSHFTARFRRLFGHTPGGLRRIATGKHVAEFRKIVTARNTLPA
jgi:AraC family transcriptional regulator